MTCARGSGGLGRLLYPTFSIRAQSKRLSRAVARTGSKLGLEQVGKKGTEPVARTHARTREHARRGGNASVRACDHGLDRAAGHETDKP